MTATQTQDERRHHRAGAALPRLALALVGLTAACGANPRAAGTTAPPGSAAVTTTRGGSPTSDPPTTSGSAATTASTTAAMAATTITPATTTTVDPGTLPQTNDRPSGTDPAFTASMALLWQAVTTNEPSLAHPAFFPLTAYRQVKAVQYPDGDYQTRLLAHFDDDIRALHTRLGTAGAGVPLLGVVVPDSQATWVLPGTEMNKGSYWRAYGAVLRYRVGGREVTYPIGSLISWRGRWYVVHLGAIR